MIFLFKLSYACGWDCHYSKLDNSEKQRIAKKIKKLNELESTRHLKHGVPFFVVEAGQYRICFEENEDEG